VLIENRPGSGGVIGGDAAAKSPPDGYTFLLDASSHSINPVLQPKMPFNTLKDLVPVSLLVVAPNMLVVHPSFPASSVKELIALVKGKPGQYSFASSGNGSAQHLAAELFKADAGLFMVHIPYRGGGPALVDVMGGQVPIFFGNMASASQHVKAGKLKALAVTGGKRSPAAPALPTIAEAGLKGYEVYEWNAIFAPAGVAPDIIERMNREAAKALALPDVREKLAALGAEPMGGKPDELEKLRLADIDKWTRVVKRAGIKLD
jgi:tripartite-type tricarboxylate transporter receptor subunit TctC